MLTMFCVSDTLYIGSTLQLELNSFQMITNKIGIEYTHAALHDSILGLTFAHVLVLKSSTLTLMLIAKPVAT